MPPSAWLLWTLVVVLRTALFILIGSALLAVGVAFYRLFLHPLASIPGPRRAAVSNIWHALQVRNGRMFRLSRTLHKQYGPVVRVGPNEVWFDSKEAFRNIYRVGSGYEKSDFYLATVLQRPRMNWKLQLHFPDTLDFLSERDMGRYRLQRRLVSPVYQTANVKRYEKAVDGVIERVLAQIRSLDGAQVDLKEWMHIVAVECLGAIVLNWSPGYLKDKTDWGTSAHGYLGWRRKSVLGLFPLMVKAELVSKELGRIFARVWGLTYKAHKDLKPFFTGVYRVSSRRIAAQLHPPTTKPSKSKAPKLSSKQSQEDRREDLLADLIRLHQQKPEFNENYLRRMAVTNFGAGHETLCSALTSILAMIGSHPSIQERVVEDIRRVDGFPTYKQAAAMPFLQATIKESQRLHPVLGMSLSRTVPRGAFHAHGHYLPPGTTVGCNPVALHRNADIFGGDPDSFNPDRWLDGEHSRGMDRFNLTWGGGGRTCPGRHLAYLILYKVVPALLREFHVETEMPPEEEIRYYFMAMLTGVKVRFRARPPTTPGAGVEVEAEAEAEASGLPS